MDWNSLGLVIGIVGGIVGLLDVIISITLYVVWIKADLKMLNVKVTDISDDFYSHEKSEDKHHNRAEYLAFQENTDKQLGQIHTDIKELRKDLTEQFRLVIETLAKK